MGLRTTLKNAIANYEIKYHKSEKFANFQNLDLNN